MPETPAPPRRSDRAALAALVAAGLLARVGAAFVVEEAARARGALCLFDDTVIYWKLAGAIRTGAPYVVDQFGVPHRALRTPGYPLFLAACQALFGASNTLGPRLVQAALGAACVALVYGLVRAVWPEGSSRRTALVAAGLAAFEPYWVGTSALLLSEAVFVPLMLGMLCGVARLWPAAVRSDSPLASDQESRVTLVVRDQCPEREPKALVADDQWHPGRWALVALLSGASAGAAVLVKPSWALAPPALLAVWIMAMRSRAVVRGAALVALGVILVMGPWWARNAAVFGRFVPTALWAGASLYDGLNPGADGSSDMRFLARAEYRTLGEVEQDRTLRADALRFARDNPGRVARLAAIKAARFWSPWPNAAEFRASRTNLASAAVTLPIFAGLAVGAWRSRRDVRALVLLGGPLVYFFALHAVFVSSIRYRIPAMVPAFGLAAEGLRRIARGWTPGGAR